MIASIVTSGTLIQLQQVALLHIFGSVQSHRHSDRANPNKEKSTITLTVILMSKDVYCCALVRVVCCDVADVFAANFWFYFFVTTNSFFIDLCKSQNSVLLEALNKNSDINSTKDALRDIIWVCNFFVKELFCEITRFI